MEQASSISILEKFTDIIQDGVEHDSLSKIDDVYGNATHYPKSMKIQREQTKFEHAITDSTGAIAMRAIIYPLRDGKDVFLVNRANVPTLALHAVGRESNHVRFYRVFGQEIPAQARFSHIGQLAGRLDGKKRQQVFTSDSLSLHGLFTETTASLLRFRVVKSSFELATFTISVDCIDLLIHFALPARVEDIVLGIVYATSLLIPGDWSILNQRVEAGDVENIAFALIIVGKKRVGITIATTR